VLSERQLRDAGIGWVRATSCDSICYYHNYHMRPYHKKSTLTKTVDTTPSSTSNSTSHYVSVSKVTPVVTSSQPLNHDGSNEGKSKYENDNDHYPNDDPEDNDNNDNDDAGGVADEVADDIKQSLLTQIRKGNHIDNSGNSNGESGIDMMSAKRKGKASSKKSRKAVVPSFSSSSTGSTSSGVRFKTKSSSAKKAPSSSNVAAAATTGRNGSVSGSGHRHKLRAIEDDRDCYYTLSFTLSFQHSNDRVYIAYFYPFTYSYLQSSLQSIESDNKRSQYIHRQPLCYSRGANICELITITEFPRNNDEAQRIAAARPLTFLSARVHPGESNASWVLKVSSTPFIFISPLIL
jgi:hypothetical protein